MTGISLIRGGSEYSQWTSASVTASMSEAARGFDLNMAEVAIGDLSSDMWFYPGEEVEVRSGDDLLARGFVNEYKPSISDTQHSVSVSGRSKSQDAVDSSADHPTGRLEGISLGDAARELAGLAGVEVSAESGTPMITRFQIDQGERIVDAIHRLADSHGYTLMGMADGSMSLIRGTGNDRYGLPLEEGRWPLKSASATITDTQRFSSYKMKSQIPGGVERFGTNAAHEIAEFQDAAVNRLRPFVGVLEVSSDGQTSASRGDWQARRMAGRSSKLDVTVQGFYFDGKLWEPNRLIFVHCPSMRISHEMLVDSVTYKQDSSGTCCDLKLVPPQAAKSKSKGNTSNASSAPQSNGVTATSPQPSESSGDPYSPEEPVRRSAPRIDLGSQWSWASEVGPQ